MTCHLHGDRAFIGRAAAIVLLMMLACSWPTSASAQLAALVSPGRLTRAHAGLEGVDKCLSCHTAGQRVSAEKCLGCHQPVAARIARKTGVHRRVTTDCVTCHVEHTGVNGDLRPFDQRTFDHGAETGFVLGGMHAAVRNDCAACHKTRSFLTATAACASCHTDPHKGTLGSNCATCHSTAVKFVAARTSFDHARTDFPLTGAHGKASCSACHKTPAFSDVKFASCTNCHTDVHKQKFGATCTSCHTTATWRTKTLNHDRTAFPLRGRHASVACAGCHLSPPTQVKPQSASCASCHTDPHQGAFPQDCAACHSEDGFKNVKSIFDHTITRFPLVEKHATVTCDRCHRSSSTGGVAARSGGTATTPSPPSPPAPRAAAAGTPRVPASTIVGFRGLETACASCHADVHRGELGSSCDTCHSSRTFAVTAFRHRNDRAFFAGAHAKSTCAQCHGSGVTAVPAAVAGRPAPAPTVPHVGFTATPTACASCHKDVHLGQVGQACETCHAIASPGFAVVGFAHQRTRFPLAGAHEQVACDRCHRTETRQFPSGPGTARHLTGLEVTCAGCHLDVHRGEVAQTCDSCHSTQTFAIRDYTHRNARSLRSFFTGRHLAAACRDCHKPMVTRPAAAAVMSFRTTTACVSCHTDVHRGALGSRCETCHRP